MGRLAYVLTDPEMVGLDRVADGDVASGSLVVVAVETEPSDATAGLSRAKNVSLPKSRSGTCLLDSRWDAGRM